MKICVGLGSADDLEAYAEAGADEVFVGYIPGWWMQAYGMYAPLNRREVLYYNVQIGSASEMEILREMADAFGIQVSVTLNALYYLPEQMPLLERYIRECLDLGFSFFIIADPALLVHLKKTSLYDRIQISISGEYGEMNARVLEQLAYASVKRVIFHRKMTIAEMKASRNDGIPEYEAFILNENCQFHGAFCNSLHCDELTHSCHLPYRPDGCSIPADEKKDMVGSTGCGLCALYDLKQAGITHLKVVGRGNYAEDMVRDIRALKHALSLLEESESAESYIRHMKQELFPEGCSGTCYYMMRE